MDAPSVAPAVTATSAPNAARGGDHSRSGNARGRGRRGRSGQQARGAGTEAPRGRGRGRQVGGRMEQDVRLDPAHYDEQTHQTTASLGELSLGQQAQNGPANGSAIEEGADDDDADLCFICASPVVHHSVAPCNHRTCHICALRLRALYKTNTCAHCRTPARFVIFTDSPDKRFEEYGEADVQQSDDNLGVKYEKPEIFEDTLLLLRYNCPDPSCDAACYGWPDLHRHVRSTHHKVMCDLCTRNKKVFTHEHELFTQQSLRKHERYGDDNPGAVDQSGFKGHPECGFCRERFYGDDELYAHCRDRHERCHVCDRREAANGSNRPNQQYYIDYNALEIHFSKDHFMCPDQECLEKKFVVFESEMDLKAHQLEAHPNGLTKDARRDARRVDMSGFDYRASRQQSDSSRGGARRENRGRGRGRDPNADTPIPTSSAQPMRRDQVAFQRQMAIQSAQSVTTRTFGGQLTSHDAVTARPPPNTSAPETISAPRGESNTARGGTSSDGAPAPAPTDVLDLQPAGQPSMPPPHLQTPADRTRALRHASIIERAMNLLGHDGGKMSTFRSKVSAYKTGAVTPSQLIDSFFTLFECAPRELGTLVKELAEAFEIAGKREALVKAWNDWRAINEDYPSLPGAPNVGASTGGAGKRILKLKSSTAQSSRSAVSRQGSWGSAASPPPSRPADAFPGLPSSAGAKGPRAGPAPTPSWLRPSGLAAGSAATASSARPSPAPSRLAASNAAPARDAFPALPAAQKPGMNVSRPGFAGSPYLRGNTSGSSTSVNAWSGFNSPPEATTPSEEDGAKKGKGKKKQTLIHWG